MAEVGEGTHRAPFVAAGWSWRQEVLHCEKLPGLSADGGQRNPSRRW